VLCVSLTVYTFWAAKRGYDFNFLGPFLFGALIVLVAFAMIQVTLLVPNSEDSGDDLWFLGIGNILRRFLSTWTSSISSYYSFTELDDCED
ncbi:LOW QUALITY PROTEIN: hypothetical protein HID58_060440, partial [Brassica napus]